MFLRTASSAKAQDAEGPHALRIHLQKLDRRTRKVQPKPNPSNAGTKRLDGEIIARSMRRISTVMRCTRQDSPLCSHTENIMMFMASVSISICPLITIESGTCFVGRHRRTRLEICAYPLSPLLFALPDARSSRHTNALRWEIPTMRRRP